MAALQVLTAARRYLLGRTLGLACLAIALPLSTSENRTVLGRYSTTYVAFYAVVLVALVWAVAASVRRLRLRARGGSFPTAHAHVGATQVAWALWGAAYLASALAIRAEAGRLLDAKVFGSLYPLSVALEWAALLALFAAAVLWCATRLPPRWRDVALVPGAVSALMLVGEGAARAKAMVHPQPLGVPTYSGLLWERRYVKRNREWFRDTDHAIAPAPGTRRLLLVGDSFAFGVGVDDPRDRLGERMAAAMTRRSGERWESINVSNPDRHTLQQIEFLKAGLRYRPDLVVLVYVFNDIDYLAERFGRPAARSRLFEAPAGMLDRVHPARVLYWNSWLAQELYVRLRSLALRAGGTGTGTADASSLYHDAVAMRVHMQDLASFVGMAGASGAAVAVVPFDPFVPADARATARYQAFLSAARGAGLPVWSLGDAFSGLSPSELTLNDFDGHPNARANHIAAERLADLALARPAHDSR